MKKFNSLNKSFDNEPVNKTKRVISSSKFNLNKMLFKNIIIEDFIDNKFQIRNIIKQYWIKKFVQIKLKKKLNVYCEILYLY